MKLEPAVEEVLASTVTAEGVDPLLGMTLDGRFRILDLLGKGAMGRVYRAAQVPLNRVVALKVLDTNFGAGRDESFRQRFLAEAALSAKLSHPNTVRLIDYGSTADGIFYLAMEFLEGETLEHLLARGPLPWSRAVGIGQQVARALRAAHDLGVVHRDLKPANVMLLSADADTDHVKVLDFGLVKPFGKSQEADGRAITLQGMLVGSPAYMAPEQGEHNRADPRADIYSLGIILYEMLSGRPPFDGEQPMEVVLKHVNEQVPPLETPSGVQAIPPAVTQLVMRCLAKAPLDRFQTMEEVLQAIGELTTPVLTPAQTSRISSETSVAVRTGPNRLALAVAFGTLVAVAGLGGLFFFGDSPPPTEERLAPSPDSKGEARPEPDGVLPVVPPRARVVFQVASDPPGAQVKLGTRVLGAAPVEVTIEEGPGGRTPVEFSLSLEGFVPLTVTAVATGPRLELVQKLERAGDAPLPPAAPTPPPEVARPPEVIETRWPVAKRRSDPARASRGVSRASKLDDDDEEDPSRPPRRDHQAQRLSDEPAPELKRPTVDFKPAAPTQPPSDLKRPAQ